MTPPATATQCSPIPPLGSILRDSPAEPLDKIKHAAGLWEISMEGLAALLKVSRAHMYRVIKGERSSARLRARIAGFFNAEVTDIWPPS
jgi:plasmid maintenance system antidote protein VapI